MWNYCVKESNIELYKETAFQIKKSVDDKRKSQAAISQSTLSND